MFTKRTTFLTVGVALLVAAVAAPFTYAAVTQTNTYVVTGSMKGAKGATKKHPKPTAVGFDYTVGEVNGLRPSPVTKYSIFFGGVVANTTAIPGCNINKLNDASNVKDTGVCPKGSVVGSGQIVNEVGVPNNPADKSLFCYLKLTLVNSSKKNHLLLYLKGGPSASTDPKKNCLISVAEAIDAQFVKSSKGVSLKFSVPANLLHPAGLDNAVTNVTSNIKKIVKTKNHKKVAYLASNNCKKTQLIKVSFTQESDGRVGTAQTPVTCTK